MNWKIGLYLLVLVMLIGTAVVYSLRTPVHLLQGRMNDVFDSVDVVQTNNSQPTNLRKILARIEVDNLDSSSISSLGSKLFRKFVTEDQEKDTIMAQFFFYKKSDVHDLSPKEIQRISMSGPKGVQIASMLKKVDTCAVYQEFSRCLVPPQMPKAGLSKQPFNIPMGCSFSSFIKLISQ